MSKSAQDFDLRVLSLGAGVQSTALYAMAALGKIRPRPDVAIFADTQAEPAHVYRTLWWLAERFGGVIPIRIVTLGNLGQRIIDNAEGRWHGQTPSLPFYLVGPDGKKGILRRQCTWSYKIEAIKQETRRVLGLRKGQWLKGKYRVEQWIGISTDEAHRAQYSREAWKTLRYPLLERDISREACLAWMKERGFPEVLKSACVFCPFHDDAAWLDLKTNHPEEFSRAVEFERRVRAGPYSALRGSPYLHASRRPLDQIVFKPVGKTGD